MAILVSVTALILAACTDAGEVDEEPPGEEATAAPEVPEDEHEEAPDTVDEERVISYWLATEPPNFNVLASPGGQAGQIMNLLYDTLTTRDENFEVVGRLAESFELSDDLTTWTFTIHEGSTWQTGDPITSADVLFSWTLYADPELAPSFSNHLNQVEGIDDYREGAVDEVPGFSAPDDQTFVVECAQVCPQLLAVAAGDLKILAPHIFDGLSNEEIIDHPEWLEPTDTSGPYRLVEWRPEEHAEVEANPDFRHPPEVDRIFAVRATDDVAAAMLVSGDLDIAQLAVDEASLVEATDGVRVESYELLSYVHLGLNLEQERFADARVRQGLLHAIDREAIVQSALLGFGRWDERLIVDDWAIPDDLVTYEYDPDRAAELLEEADFPFDEPIEIMIIPGTDRDDAAIAIQSFWGDIGIEVTIDQVDAPEAVERMHEADPPKPYDVFIGGGRGAVHPSFLRTAYHSSAVRPAGGNYAFVDPEMDRLIEEAEEASTPEEMEEAWQEVMRYINEQQPDLLLYKNEVPFGISDRVDDILPYSTAALLTWNAENWRVVD